MPKHDTTPVRKEDENVPTYDQIRGLDPKILRIAESMEEQKSIIAEANKRLDELKDEGIKLMVKARVKTVMCGDLRVTKVDGVSSRLNKDKLYKLGGKKVMDMLDKATDRTPWTSLKVTPPKREEEEE